MISKELMEKIKAEILETFNALWEALIITFFILTFVVQAFKIPSGSMIPTLKAGDRIFVNKFLYSARVPLINFRLPILDIKQPKRGDIIVFVSPEDPKKDFVKRLIALGGETVEIRGGRILINGKMIDGPSSMSPVYYQNAGDYGVETRAVTVPPDSYFVLGDNSANSRDSRYWGFVPKKNLVGKAVLIYWPLNRMKLIN
jgi:signal peptidase I